MTSGGLTDVVEVEAAGDTGALALLQTSATLEEGFKKLHAMIGSMGEIELMTLYHHAAFLGKQAWLIQAHVLAEAKQRKAHQNDGGVRAAAEMFGISPSNASGYIRTWESFSDEFLAGRAPYDHLIGVSWYKTSAYTDSPKVWLEAAAQKKATNPSYSIRDFKSDIEAGRIGSGEGKPPAPAQPVAPRMVPAPSLDPVASGEPIAPAPAPVAPIPAAIRRQVPAEVAYLGEPSAFGGQVAPVAASGDPLVDLYLRAVGQLSEALNGTDVLIYHTDPADLAARLPPLTDDALLDQKLLLKAFAYFGTLFAKREEGRDTGRARRGRGGAARVATA